jgi:ABC-type transport system involved in multi-copper enzyme maturation permease subunit
MKSVAAKTWRETRGVAFAYLVILEIGVIAAVAMWPNLKTEAAALGRIIPAKFLQRMFEAMSNPDQTTAYNAYMAMQLFFKGSNIIGLAFAVLLGTGMIARERENQTLEFLLARPIARGRVLRSKFLVIAAAMLAPIFLTSMSAVPLSWLVEENLDPWRVLGASTHAAAFALLFLCATTVVSVVCRNQVHVAAIVGAFIVVEVVLFFVQVIRAVSVFRLADFDVFGPLLMGHGNFDDVFFSNTVWVLLACAGLYGVADWLFRRLDL